jgi:hypothetical protein
MAFTGVDFQNAFERRVDKMFNDYYDVQTSIDFYKRVLRLGLIEKYDALDKQKRYDELRSFIVLNKKVPNTSLQLNTNRILLQDLPVVGIGSNTITTGLPHNFSIGDVIFINLVGSNSTLSINDTVVSVISPTQVQLQNSINIGTFVSGYARSIDVSIMDYLRLNSIKVKYKVESKVDISGFNVTPNKVEFIVSSFCKLRTGDFISLTGVQGTTNANGDWYVKQTAPKKYQLFQDSLLTIPVLGNSKYLGGGTLYEYITTEPIFQEKPDEIAVIDKPSYMFPRWYMSEGSIVLEPSLYLNSAYISYLRIPPFIIDPLDNELDLLLYMPQELIEFLVDYAAKLFDLETKDWQSINFDNNQVITNK